jgi:hypothetical protein
MRDEFPKCKDCIFWEGNPEGLCRFNPPIRNSIGNSVWPMSSADDWCGKAISREIVFSDEYKIV